MRWSRESIVRKNVRKWNPKAHQCTYCIAEERGSHWEGMTRRGPKAQKYGASRGTRRENWNGLWIWQADIDVGSSIESRSYLAMASAGCGRWSRDSKQWTRLPETWLGTGKDKLQVDVEERTRLQWEFCVGWVGRWGKFEHAKILIWEGAGQEWGAEWIYDGSKSLWRSKQMSSSASWRL